MERRRSAVSYMEAVTGAKASGEGGRRLSGPRHLSPVANDMAECMRQCWFYVVGDSLFSCVFNDPFVPVLAYMRRRVGTGLRGKRLLEDKARGFSLTHRIACHAL